MENICGGKSARRCSNGAAGRTRGIAADFAAFLHDGWPASAVNRAIHAAPAAQTAIGGVDDGIGAHLYNITLEQRQCDAVDGTCRHKQLSPSVATPLVGVSSLYSLISHHWHWIHGTPTRGVATGSPIYSSSPKGSSSRRLTSCRKRAAVAPSMAR